MARNPSQKFTKPIATTIAPAVAHAARTFTRPIQGRVRRKAGHTQMKDLKGALFWIAVIIAAGLLFLSVGCSVSPAYRPTIKFGALREVDRKFGDSGWVGHVTISQPIHYFGKHPSCIAPPSVEALYLHGSDLLRQDDLTTVDAVGPVFSVPLGRVK